MIGKESLKINKLEQVLIEKVWQLFRDLLSAPAVAGKRGSEHGFRGVIHVAFGQRLAQFFHGPALDLADSFL